MSRTKAASSSIAVQAARLAALLASPDPAAAQARTQRAARHFDRTRRGRDAAPASKAMNAEPRAYVHDTPTRSPVLNAFLHELRGDALIPVDVAVYDEHTLAPALLECARRYIAPMIAMGDADLALTFAEQFPPIVGEAAARMYLRQAARVAGELGAMARDYAAHRDQAQAAQHDDRLASCIMAAFAGRMLAYAARRLGPHVRRDVRAELQRLTSEERAASRRPAGRTLQTPGSADPAQASATADPLDSGGARLSGRSE